MAKTCGRVIGVLSALALWHAPAFGAEMVVSRDIEILGEDVVGHLERPMAEMEEELTRQGCRAVTRAFWSDSVPLRILHVELRCKDSGAKERLSLGALPCAVLGAVDNHVRAGLA